MKATLNSSGQVLADHPSVEADTPHVQGPSGSTTPPPETVLIFLTKTVERHYAELSVFPKLREPLAHRRSGNSSIFYATRAEADEVLAHAIKLRSIPNATPGASYSAHIKSLKHQIEEAAGRPKRFSSATPTQTHKSNWWEGWEGTQAQLLTLGIPADTQFPVRGDTGPRRRRVDDRGYSMSIRPASQVWPDWYRLEISTPFAMAQEREVEALAKESNRTLQQRASEQARLRLAAMPSSATRYRLDLVNALRSAMGDVIRFEQKPSHGYSFDPEPILMSFDAVVQAVMDAEMKFDALVHAGFELRHRADIAAGDTTFRKTLASLVSFDKSILQGEAK